MEHIASQNSSKRDRLEQAGGMSSPMKYCHGRHKQSFPGVQPDDELDIEKQILACG
jgi:hypothetical protein